MTSPTRVAVWAPGDSEAVDTVHPTLRFAAPFIAMASLGTASAFLRPREGAEAIPVAAVAVFAVTLVFVVLSIRRGRRTWIDPVAPWLFFVVIALVRDATGGAESSLNPLLALPIVWLAIVGTRTDLLVAAALAAVTLVAPIYLVGGPDYLASDWRGALVWVAFAVLIGPAIQSLVRRLEVETHKERESSAHLDAILRGAHLTSLITTTPEGIITSFGVGAEELLGYRAEDVVGLTTPDFLHDPDEVLEVAQELGVLPHQVFPELARRNAPSRIWTHIHADGTRISVRLAMTEMIDSNGALIGTLGVAIDSTAAVQAEKALALAEGRWRALLDHLPELTVVVLDHGLCVRAVAGAGVVANNLQDAVGKAFDDISKPENLIILRPLIDAAFLGHEGNAEVNATAHGAEQEVLIAPLPGERDGPRALLLSRDVSRDRARERDLMRARDRAERLFADAPHGVAILTPAGTVMQVNHALGAMAGAVPGGIVGKQFALLGAASGDHRLATHLDEVWATPGGRADAEWTLCGPDGDDVHVALSSAVLRGDDHAADVVLVNVVDVSERRNYELRLAHLAEHDALTGLANRRRFDHELARHLDRCKRYGAKGALLLLDLDHFKEVNDTLGHAAGDQLLISTGALLRKGLRSDDTVARLGGDEFAILLPEADRAGAETVARSVVARIQEFTATFDGIYRRVTASVGVVTVQAASEHSADILALADMTMYDAKENGRNSFVVLGEGDSRLPRSGARLEWKRRIENALVHGDFAIHLQPILDLDSGLVRSAEVLVRLDDSDELVMPARFLYVAERYGLMPLLDAWVVQHSLPLLARLREFDPGFQLEINLSGQSIGDPDVERALVESLRENQIDPGAVILEITETAAVADVEVARQFAERMIHVGCKFALDDFGAGFGSFYYLKHLLFDYVKIDGEFVASCHTSSIDRSILRSIVGIAHDLGKRTVAEFVTEPEVLEIVRAEGVDLAQGYLVGKPVPYDEFEAAFLAPDAMSLWART